MVHVRTGGLADLDTIVNFNRQMAMETEGLALVVPELTEGVRKVVAGEVPALYFVAELAGFVIGQLMITKEWSDWRNREVWWIQSVYVHPDHRNQGVFKTLYRHVRDLAQQTGAAGVRLYADVQNSTAHAAYERLGMTSHYKVYEDMMALPQANGDNSLDEG